MKILISILMSIFLFSCGNDSGNKNNIVPQTTQIPDDGNNDDDDVVTDPDPVTEEEIIIALIGTDRITFYDGTEFTTWNTGAVKYAGNCQASYNDIVHVLDEYGGTVSTDQLIVEPDFLIKNSDTWIVEKIAPADAYAAGAMHDDYSKVYKNNVEVGNWYLNQWLTVDLRETYSGDIIAVNEVGSLHHLNGSYEDIFHADALLIYNFDAIARTATIRYDDNYSASWSTNYMSSARAWQESDGTFYSNNGYAWSPAGGLLEDETVLHDFNSSPYSDIVPNGEYAYVIGAGSRTENSEIVLYWLECNSGWIFRYVPSVDLLEQKFRLYTGDGMRTTGIAYSKTVKPVIIGDSLYYNESNTVWKLDLDTGNASSFYSGSYEVKEW